MDPEVGGGRGGGKEGRAQSGKVLATAELEWGKISSCVSSFLSLPLQLLLKKTSDQDLG